jgi:Tfp pilus assembly protein PilF
LNIAAQAIAADSRHMGAHYNLALALHAVGEVESAHAALVSALAIQPDARILRSVLLFLLCHQTVHRRHYATCRTSPLA